MSKRVLTSMSIEDFNAIPQSAVSREVQEHDLWLESPEVIECLFGSYAQLLILDNESLHNMLLDETRRKIATRGQRILCSLWHFDCDIRNGGITQFFWNCFEGSISLLEDVSEALKLLDVSDLSNLYEKALESFLDNQERWNEIQEQSAPDEAYNDSYEKFRAFFGLGWFDDAYRENSDAIYVSNIPIPGMASAMRKRLVDYVRTNPEEFIRT